MLNTIHSDNYPLTLLKKEKEWPKNNLFQHISIINKRIYYQELTLNILNYILKKSFLES